MSFNYLEIARAAAVIAESLPDEVQAVELVRFPLEKGAVADISVGLRLKRLRKTLVFSLKQPWTGLFFMPSGAFPPAGTKGGKTAWSTAFNGCEGAAADWNHYIQGKILERVSPLAGDRVVELFFSDGLTLRVELFPARPNWMLAVAGQEFRWRTSLVARPGVARPGLARPGIARPVREGVPSGLAVREFEGVGPSDADWMARAYHYYLGLRRQALLASQIQRAAGQLQTRLTKVIKIRGQMEHSLAESAKADELRAQAERLKACLYELPQGHKARELDGVTLDPRYSVAENVTRMFSQYKKLQRTKKEVEARLIGIEEESKRITGAIVQIRQFQGDYTQFLSLAEKLGIEFETPSVDAKKPTREQRKWQELSQKSGVRRFQSKEGLAIWVGRNHRENEELVIRLARGNDLWMHLKGRPGAHVVVQLPSGKSASLDALLDGATLVAYYSGVQNNEKVEVDYTYRKYVKRVPGGGPDKFLVTYTQNKTLMVKMEDERLWRLLKQH